MKRSNRLVLLIGIFLALVAFVLILFTLNSGGPTPTETTADKTTIVVAARNVPLGATFQDADVREDEIDITKFPPDGIKLKSLVVGQIARAEVTAGQAITQTVLSGGSGTAKNIDVPPGKVAMSIKVNQVSGVGTIIKPGDYVDAVVAFKIIPVVSDPDTGDPKSLDALAGTSVKALLQSMQVLATLLPTPAANQGAEPTPSGGTGGSTSLSDREQIVILAVTTQQAEVLNYAQVDGVVEPNGITLVLRSTKDFVDALGSPSIPPDTLTTGVVLALLVDRYGVLVPGFDLPSATLPPGPSPSPSPSGSASPSPVP